MNVKILRPAELELKDAYDFYESQLAGLGKRFKSAFVETVELVVRIPSGWCQVSSNTRRINIKRNPSYYERHYR